MDDREAVLYTGQTFTGRSGHDYVLGSKIGDGGFAGIFLAVEQGTGREVAVKVLAISNRRAEAVGEFQDEAALLGVLTSCSNVVTLIDHGEHVMHLQAQGGGPVLPVPVPFMVLERAVGSLEELLANRHQIEWIDRLTLYREVAKGVHQMHLRRFVHRDVKSENGLVFEDDPKARISDLGRSKNTRDDARFPPIAYEAGRGDIRFAPPELLWRLGDDSAATHFRIDLY
ncbi:MAG TPA: protein kinase, partial [Gaiellaceae bacterium]|nr:protein kinase [Gaiellaceae bacterium]